MLKRYFIFFLNILWCFCAYGMENLALNKSYTFSPKPNYQLCTDDADAIQLTDGKTSGSKWTQKSTVGWRKPEPFVEVIIDLGQKCVVREVNVHTIGGGAATVEFPEFIAVLLSDTNNQFRFAGMISGRTLEKIRSNSNSGISRVMSIKDINAAGRFVKLVIRPNGPLVFMDEIEIVGEKTTEAINNNVRDNLETVTTDENLLNTIEDYLQFEDNSAEVEKLSGKIDGFMTGRLRDKENILAKQKARIYNDKYKKPFVCLPANPMEIVFEKEVYLRDSANEINIQMWQNEYESAAFNIINCSEQSIEMNISISPLIGPNGQMIDSDKVFAIRRAQYVMASQAGSIADALILTGENSFKIEPGQMIQIWLTIHNTELTAGDYEAKIAVSGISVINTIPINLKIYENKLTNKLALNTCVWDYYQAASEQEMANDLHNHYVNVCVVPAQKMPFLRFSSDKLGVTRKPDYSKLDETIKIRQYAGIFLLGMNFSVTQKDYGRFGDVKWMSKEWKEVFSSWLEKLVLHLKERGIGYDKFALYPFDESIGDDYYELAQMIKSVDPQIRLYANSFGKGPDEFLRFRELIDIWCLQDSYIVKHPDWFEKIKSFGKQMWTYECFEPMKVQKPYSYYRLLPWRAFQRKQSGAGFWIYYYGLGFDPGAVPWNDTLRPHGFSGVVYGTKTDNAIGYSESIIPSRRWEAWREGVEDYQYLYELQQMINKTRITNARMAEQAQKILDEQVDGVVNSPDNCNLVYEAREILTDTLQKLTH